MPKTTKKSTPESKTDKMPLINCGGHVMEWDQYWAMLRDMEKRQAPFKKWIEKEFTPEYDRYLKKNFAKRASESHSLVAEFFFDRALHVGFLNFESIRHEFALKEFPRWWKTHVMGVSETPTQVAASMKVLLVFVKEAYQLEAIGKWPNE